MKTKIGIVSQLFIFALVIGAISLAGVVKAETTPTGQGSSLSEKDKTFMKKAAKGERWKSRWETWLKGMPK